MMGNRDNCTGTFTVTIDGKPFQVSVEKADAPLRLLPPPLWPHRPLLPLPLRLPLPLPPPLRPRPLLPRPRLPPPLRLPQLWLPVRPR